MIRALLLTLDFPPTRGGIQTMVREIVERSTRIDFSVLAPADPGHAPVDAGLPVPVRRVRSVAPGRRGYVLPLGVTAVREARRFRPDVVFAAHVLATPAALLLRGRGVPCVLVVHGTELYRPRIRTVARRVLPRADRVVAVSRATADEAAALGAPADHLAVIPHGAPEPAAVPAERIARLRARLGLNGHRTLLTVARLEPHKGIDRVIEALPSLPGDLRYLVVGGGPARASLERAAARAGVANRVILAGALDDEELAACYRIADAFALLSRPVAGGRGGAEGLGIVLLEAGAYGLPVVAGRSGGIPDAVADGETGLLVDPEDPAAIRRALGSVLGDPGLARRLGERARAAALGERSWSRAVRRIEDVLIDLAGEAGR